MSSVGELHGLLLTNCIQTHWTPIKRLKMAPMKPLACLQRRSQVLLGSHAVTETMSVMFCRPATLQQLESVDCMSDMGRVAIQKRRTQKADNQNAESDGMINPAISLVSHGLLVGRKFKS